MKFFCSYCIDSLQYAYFGRIIFTEEVYLEDKNIHVLYNENGYGNKKSVNLNRNY